jgi:phosphoglycolate phosphatase
VTHSFVFDLDGTLVDSLPGIAMSLNRALQHVGLETHSLPAVRSFIGDGAEMLVKRAVVKEPRRWEEVLGLFREFYADDWKMGTMPYEGIREMLQELKQLGYSLSVLSNKPHPFTVQIVETLFPETFARVMGQRAGIPHKPDPAGLIELMRDGDWQEDHVVMIGDSLMDLETARAAGVKEIAVSWGYHDRAALLAIEPRMMIDDVPELHCYLLSLR